MKIIVMKFGGASLSTTEHFRRAAQRVCARKAKGYFPVVVVSAMGRETDRLLALAQELGASPTDGAEIDVALAAGEQVSAGLFALALAREGMRARSFLAQQLPIHTDGNFGDAKITQIETEILRRTLAEGRIPVVAGFQGIDFENRVVTLGRGGSDTTAVALSAALDAQVCEFYKDVDGVYPIDPKLDPSASMLTYVSYERMKSISGGGARILHAQAVALADRMGVALHVRSAFQDGPGTWIGVGTKINQKRGALHA